MSSIMVNNQFAEKILNQLADVKSSSQSLIQKDDNASSKSFAEHLKDGVQNVNKASVAAEAMANDLATGKTGNIHETMLSATKAELSFNLMVQLRNKGLEAYAEIMRMPV